MCQMRAANVRYSNARIQMCSANARLYIIVALCQSIPLYPSGTVPKYTSISQWHCASVSLYIYFLVALCQSMPLWLFSCCTVPIPTSVTIFLWHCANTYLYDYFPVALCQYLLIHVCILVVLKV